MDMYQAIYAIGIFAGPFFTGIFNSFIGLKAGFVFVSLLCLITIALLLYWRKKDQENMKATEVAQRKSI